MDLLTKAIRAQLRANGQRAALGEDVDPLPVVKLFLPDSTATWLLTESDIEDPDIMFGLCDLGQGFPELGSVRLSDLKALRGPMGLAVERDLGFVPDKSLSAYAAHARRLGQLIA